MKGLLIIADDFTGALDTGVQFAARGAATKVVTNILYDFTDMDGSTEVLVMDAETRHLEFEKAYDVVYHVVKHALDAGITHIYKKTDSALRGNIGSELSAVMDAANIPEIAFAPAFPKTNRTTCRGIHYIDGLPVAESVFGKDPFEPVCHSEVEQILKEKTNKTVVHVPLGETAPEKPKGIVIYDARTDEDLKRIGLGLSDHQRRFCAGCAGFASAMADVLGINGAAPVLPELKDALFIACGSVNPVTLTQMDTAQQAGFFRVCLTPEQKLEEGWLETDEAEATISGWLETAEKNRRFILDVNDADSGNATAVYAEEHGLTVEDLRVRIAANLAAMMKRLLDKGLNSTILCTGGDTLLAVMNRIGIKELIPVCEVSTGVVLTYFVYQGNKHYILSKSGGFGEEDLFVKLAKLVNVE